MATVTGLFNIDRFQLYRVLIQNPMFISFHNHQITTTAVQTATRPSSSRRDEIPEAYKDACWYRAER